MNDLLKKLGLSVDVNVKTEEINKTLYIAGAIAIACIFVYSYSK